MDGAFFNPSREDLNAACPAPSEAVMAMICFERSFLTLPSRNFHAPQTPASRRLQ
jgi:hypothetical protein